MAPDILFLFVTTLFCSSNLIGESTAQELRTDSLTLTQENPCLKDRTTTCGECITISTLCAFCTDSEYDTNNYPRCDLLTTHQKLINNKPRCKDIVNPSSSLVKTKDDELIDGDTGRDAVQLKPQEIDLVLRPNDPQTFDLTYRLAENVPVDLYYLMDLSSTMADDKVTLASLGIRIADEMSTISRQFKMGFGSFVDKAVMPFVSTAKNKINSPCPGCEKAYGFRNVLPLNLNATLFKEKVNLAKVSDSLDAPEGGFDAIMQAIACKGQIGWRTGSRRLLLFSTDSGFHYAGDGKLGGILQANDGNCHLDSNGMYTDSSNKDYPSLSQIAVKAKENNVNLVFAVTDEQKNIYHKLIPLIAGSEIGVLDSDSQNIVKLVRDNYLAIISKVELIVENSDNMEVKIRTKCKGTIEKETNRCENLSLTDQVVFSVTLGVKSCPPKGQEMKTIKIKPVGLQDTLTVNVRIKCQCDCDSDQKMMENKNHANCNGNGTFVCGMCVCNEPYFGVKCDCIKGEVTPPEKDRECIQDKSTTTLCNGRGECSCGRCLCRETQKGTNNYYTGKYCECDDTKCPYYGGLICGGLSRGQCICGVCNCNSGFTGDSCGCSTDKSPCMYNNLECNGAGVCECGKCKCTNPKYFGSHCQECEGCDQEKCRAHQGCALCNRVTPGVLTQEQCKTECPRTTAVNTIRKDTTRCETLDKEGCFVYFTYFYDADNNIRVEVQREPVCPTKPNIGAIVGGVLTAIVLIVLGILIAWKVLITLKDRREYFAFLKSIENPTWEAAYNPLYKPATSTFNNPTFGQKSHPVT
ncbi:integrin beta-1-B isoform X1 [Magallana gigas]|uniref:integrin beta-1-B isoform X1 n=1 Tax=Magallana gigas TaxID=29159 RepID=UPI00333ED4C6